MPQFELLLKNGKVRSYRLIRFFVLLGNAAGMFYILFNAVSGKEKIWPAFVLVCIGFQFFFSAVEGFMKKFTNDNWARSIYIWCAIAWMRTTFWWLSLLMLALALLDYLAHRKLLVKINKSCIQYPGFTTQKIEWPELNNIVLKDGLLTIDFKNNKLFQHAILNSDWDIDEKYFNDFCRAQLNK